DSASTTADVSDAWRPLYSGDIDDVLVVRLRTSAPAITVSTTAPIPIFCSGVSRAARSLTRVRSLEESLAAMLDLHLHDVVEGLHGLVPNGDGELCHQLRFGRRNRVVLDRRQVARRGLHRELVDVGVHRRERVELR